MSKGYLYDNGEGLILRDENDYLGDQGAPNGSPIIVQNGTLKATFMVGVCYKPSTKILYMTETKNAIRKAIGDGIPVYFAVNTSIESDGSTSPTLTGCIGRVDSDPETYKISFPQVPVQIYNNVMLFIKPSPFTVATGDTKTLSINDNQLYSITGTT